MGDTAIEIRDPASLMYLKKKLDHEPPFSESEIAGLESVSPSGCDGLAWLLQCRSAWVMSARRSQIGPWMAEPESLAVIPNLVSIDFSFSSLSSLQAAVGHPELKKVFCMDSHLEDARPLLTLPSLKGTSVIGCPLSEESYLEIVPQIRAMPSSPTVKVSPEPDWRLTLAIHGRGIRASYSQGKVIAPGLAYSKLPDLHSWTVTHDDVKRVLDQVDDGDLQGFMDRCRDIAHGK